MQDFQTALRQSLKDCQETEETSNLQMTVEEFVSKMLEEPRGSQLIELLIKGEVNICERMGLMHVKQESVFVPGWKNLVAHLEIVNEC